MTYDQAINYLTETLKYDTEEKLINFTKEILYDLELPINERTVKNSIITYAEYLKANLLYLN